MWETSTAYAMMVMYLAGLLLLLLRRVKPARYLLGAAAFPGLALFAYYVYAFLSNDFNLDAVYQNSSTGLPLLYRLSASWTTAGGSLLLLVAMMGGGLLVHELRALSKGDQGRVTSMVVSFLGLYFLIALVSSSPFGTVGGSPSNGLGLTPSLQSYWAAVHPPTIFAAYVLCIFAYSNVLSSRLSSVGSRLADGRLLTASWVLLGAGILLGAVWAYQTLGWGGYWDWDPIETSALVPWLAISAVLFARRLGRLNLELFGMTLAASALLLISYVARGSVGVSLHSYGDLASALPFVVLAVFPIFFSLAVLFRPSFSIESDEAFPKTEFYLLEFWSLVLLASANLALLLLEVFGGDFGYMFAPNPLLHDYLSFPFLLAFATLLIVESAMRRPTMKWVVILAPVLLAIGIALWFGRVVTSSPYLAVGLPFFLALAGSGSIGVVSTLSSRPARAPAGSTVRYLTVLGIGLMLLGVLISSSMRTTASGDLGVGDSVSAGGVKLTVLSISTVPSADTVDMPGHGIVPEAVDTRVTYSVTGETGGSGALLEYFPVPDQYFSVPSLYGSLTEDVYVVANATTSVDQASAQVFQSRASASPPLVGITLQTIPGISLVWIGAVIMLVANLYFVLRRTQYAS